MAQGHLPAPTVGITTVTIPRNMVSEETAVAASSTRETRREALRRRTGRSKTPPRAPASTPPRLSHNNSDSISPRPARGRVNSRDYTHSYDGAYGSGNEDMVGVTVAATAGGWWENHRLHMFTAYILVLMLMVLVVLMIVSSPPFQDTKVADLVWTITNTLHFAVTLIYLHWLRGGCGDGHGELDHMTLWEQIEATPNTGWFRLALRLIPILLCYLACIEAGWGREYPVCYMNAIVCFFSLLGKMPFMNGVRILNINAHPVIDKEE